jgi:DNA-binding beta-propeller fold protein YncE
MATRLELDTLLPGTIVTVAGSGEPGYAGDGGPAVTARLNEPKAVVVDEVGHLYIADSENNLVRRVDLDTGIITTVAGRALEEAQRPSRSGDVSAPTEPMDDDLLDSPGYAPGKMAQLADLSGTVRFVVGSAASGRYHGDEGPATEAVLNFPSAVVVDRDGNLYIADTRNHRVRKLDAVTGRITTVAGTGRARFSGDGGPAVNAALNEPAALAIDEKHLYIADQSNNRVRMVDLATGVIVTVAGTGEAAYTGDGMPAVEAALAGPSGLALSPTGDLFIADTFNGRVRVLERATGRIRTVAGDGATYRYQGLDQEFSTSLSRPYGIALERSGHLLITDSDSHLIRRWDCGKRIITRLAGSGAPEYKGDGGPCQGSALNYPFGVAVDAAGNIYIADTFNHRVRMIANAK